jgi:hypothetical protein
MGSSVFVVQHLHPLPQGDEDTKLIGVYSTRERAVAAIERLRGSPGFRQFPELVFPGKSESDEQGFYIDEYEVDLDHWTEGYETR